MFSPSSSRRRCAARPPVELVSAVEAAVHAEGWGRPPLLLALTADDRPVLALADSPARTDDLVADLIGVELPAECHGLLVVAEGRGRRMDGGEPCGRHRLAYAIDRADRSATVLRAEGAAPVVGAGEGPDAPGGRLVDVCRRAVGLPTAPAPERTTRFWSSSWLDAVLARSLATPSRPSWPELLRLHPVVETIEAVAPDVDVDRIDPAMVHRLCATFGEIHTWAELRSRTADGEWSAGGLGAAQARSMDDGMFARWVLGDLLAPAVYLAELRDLLGGEIADSVELAVGDLA